jgi:hypothetical protein
MRTSRKPLVQGRRHPRFHLDVDWFVEAKGCSTFGRALEVSVRGALLPVACLGLQPGEVTLHLSLPARERMFKARCRVVQQTERGWVLTFLEVEPDDLQLLGQVLLHEFGPAALPNLERRPERLAAVES